MPSTSSLDYAQMMHNAGFPTAAIPTGLAIMQAESGGNPAATNHNTNGSTDYGLFQINSVHSSILQSGNWQDPQSNINMAYQVYKNAGNSWSPWSTYNSGAYQRYLALGAPNPPLAGNGTGLPIAPIWPRIFGNWGGSGTSPNPSPSPSPQSSPAPAPKTGGTSKTNAWGLPPNFNLRFLWFLLGLLLLIAGIIILFRKPIGKATIESVKAAKLAAV